jgi:hypothetical protein
LPCGTQHQTLLLSLPTTSLPLKWVSPCPVPPFLPLCCSEWTVRAPSHIPCILSAAGHQRAIASPVLKPRTVVTSATPVSATPRSSSTYLLRASPSPPPHLAAGTTPTALLRTSLSPHAISETPSSSPCSVPSSSWRRPCHKAANDKPPGGAPPHRPSAWRQHPARAPACHWHEPSGQVGD